MRLHPSHLLPYIGKATTYHIGRRKSKRGKGQRDIALIPLIL